MALPTSDELRHLVRVERAKLTAAFVNTISGGMIVTGIVGPFALVLFGIQRFGVSGYWMGCILIVVAFFALLGHVLALKVLEELDP